MKLRAWYHLSHRLWPIITGAPALPPRLTDLYMPPRYWLFVTLTLALTAVVSLATYRSSRLLQHWKPDRNLLLLLSENAIRIVLIALCLVLGWLSGLPAETLGWSFAGWRSDLLQGLLWGVGMAAAFYLATKWIVVRSGERHYSRVVVEAMLPRDNRELAWTVLAMVGVVVTEELLFRSLLLGGLQPILPAPILVMTTSVVFGVLHLPQKSWGVVGATAAGALLGVLFLVSGSILAPIVAHYVTNLVQIVQAMRTGTTLPVSTQAPLDD